jgi:hypothetical protein
MSQPADTWYVRLPDGRVLRAASTHVVRQHLGAGRIPPESRVRRSEYDEWIALDWTEEFADLAHQRSDQKTSVGTIVSEGAARSGPPAGASRPGSAGEARLRTVGLSALVEELLAALDNTLAGPKLLVAGIGCIVAGLCVAAALAIMPSWLDQPPWWLPPLAAAGVGLLIWVIVNVLVTQMTYTELSRLRPATWREARAGILRYSIRLLAAYLTVGGLGLAAIWALRWTPAALQGRAGIDAEATIPLWGIETAAVVALLLEVLLWPLIGLSLLLAPVVVIEESSVVRSLGHWWWLIRRHLGRLFLYEAAALVGGSATLVFALPLVLASVGRQPSWDNLQSATGLASCALVGLVAAPLVAYLVVAQVFIYLNLRYGVHHARR